ncbi:MAG: SycD/LcrH family type III secretion system chaperone [Pseudomonadota bacterium]
MTVQAEITEADIRAAVDRFGEVIPGVSNKKVADHAVAALKGELVLKDAHGLTDSSMEAVYEVAYNEFQANRFEEAHRLFVFLCMFDHLNEKYWMALGACRFGAQNYGAAAAAYGMAGMIDEADPNPPLRAADCYLADGDVDTAIEALDHAIKLCGGDPRHAAGRKRAEAIREMLSKNANAATAKKAG